MQKNSLLKYNNSIIRVLNIKKEQLLIIDCIKRTMPGWIAVTELESCTPCSQAELMEKTDINVCDISSLDAKSQAIIHERFTMIAGILPYISNTPLRNKAIREVSLQHNISQQTIRNYLCLYLTYQDKSVLAPKRRIVQNALTKDEKNMRWGLNKFFYNQKKNSLNTAYTMMLKEKYCDSRGILQPEHPTFNQFRYFYRKTKKLQNYYISRNGIKDYQKNHRPLLGDGVQEFASHVGVGMLDATVCDIYLINDSGDLVGRPILTACVDGYSGLCCGYSLSWEGGTYSLRGLMLNVIADKVEHCKQFGISIQKTDWDCDKLPATLVTDMGSEYVSETFSQITELGVTLINLPAYRPELKGSVEKFFDLIQGYFKPHLKGKGVIEPDFQQRGSHDYRKDACLTMSKFETIVLRCIIYYNTKQIIENYPYSVDMIDKQIRPFSSSIWNYGLTQVNADLITVTNGKLILTLLPRTQGKFSRQGLKANGMKYKHENYTERYLSGGTVTVAYNPDDVSCIWLVENDIYIRFELIESRYRGETLSSVEILKENQKSIVKANMNAQVQAQIDLANYIEAIASNVSKSENSNTKGIRANRQKEQAKTHVDFIEKAGVLYE